MHDDVDLGVSPASLVVGGHSPEGRAKGRTLSANVSGDTGAAVVGKVGAVHTDTTSAVDALGSNPLEALGDIVTGVAVIRLEELAHSRRGTPLCLVGGAVGNAVAAIKYVDEVVPGARAAVTLDGNTLVESFFITKVKGLQAASSIIAVDGNLNRVGLEVQFSSNLGRVHLCEADEAAAGDIVLSTSAQVMVASDIPLKLEGAASREDREVIRSRVLINGPQGL